MSEKPLALWLADQQNDLPNMGLSALIISRATAAMLREQHAELENLRSEADPTDAAADLLERQHAELVRLRAENAELKSRLEAAEKDAGIVLFLRCGGWEVLQDPKYWTASNRFYGAIAQAMADVSAQGIDKAMGEGS